MTGGIEGAGRKRAREEESDDHAAKRARINIQGSLHSVHRMASLRKVDVQKHPELALVIQTLAKNLQSISQQHVESMKQDITQIKNRLHGSSDEKSEVIKEIDSLLSLLTPLGIVKKGVKRAREVEASLEPKTKRAREELQQELQQELQRNPNLSFETIGEIASHLEPKEAFKLQGVSKAVASLPAVQKAREQFADAIAKKAIDDALKKGLPLSSLENTLTEALRNSVLTLNLRGLRTIGADDLSTLARIFPNIRALVLSNTSPTEQHLVALGSFRHLNILSLKNCGLTDDRIPNLSHLTSLQELNLSFNNELTGITFNRLPASLVKFFAIFCNVTDGTIPNLSHLISLQALCLDLNFQVTGSTFNRLPASLVTLVAHECIVPRDTITRLRKERPNLNFQG